MKRIIVILTTLALLGVSLSVASARQSTPEATPAASDLTNIEWHWQEFQAGDGGITTVDSPANYTLTFNPDGTLALKADCNVGSGAYTQNDSQLSITLGPMTLAFCPPGSLADDYVSDLGNVVSYVIQNEQLSLNLKDDAGTMVFSPAPAITGVEWQWQELQSADGTTTTVDTPANYLLTFNEDGTVDLQADCNMATASYTLDGSQLTITPGIMTLAACPPGSLSDLYLKALFAVASYSIQDGDLYLTLKTGGIMHFSPAPAEITDVEWQWQEFQGRGGSTTTVDTPANYTLMLNTDGTAHVKADCNTGNGPYTLNGSQLTIGPLATTRAACPPSSLSDKYLGYLGAVTDFVVQDGELLLNLKADGGTLRFAQAQ